MTRAQALLTVLDSTIAVSDRVALLDSLPRHLLMQIAATEQLERQIRVEAYRRSERLLRKELAALMPGEEFEGDLMTYYAADSALRRHEKLRARMRAGR